MMFYRIRCREGKSGKTCVIKDNIPTIGEVYQYISTHGNTSSGRKYYIDKYEFELFSVVTAKVAKHRLDEIKSIYLEEDDCNE